MTESLLNAEWVERLALYQTLHVGFSGGLDSTVLLHLLAAEPLLKKQVCAVHINHGLSPFAHEWEAHCERACHELGVRYSGHRIKLVSTSNIEESARAARYGVFHSILKSSDALVLAHHQDDQSETFLLNLMRGSGIDGLTAMLPVQVLEQGDLIRPLLSISRSQMEVYAREHGLSWVEDESNQQEHFSRNYIRHRIIPLLKAQWPAASKNIARAATHCQQARKNLGSLAEIDGLTRTNQLSLASVKYLPIERLFNVLRTWIEQNGYRRPSEKNLHRLMNELIFAKQDAEPMVSFGHAVIRRYQEVLYCLPGCVNVDERERSAHHVQDVEYQTLDWADFPSPLSLGASIGTLYAEPSNQGVLIPAASNVTIRYRRGGESFRWHGQTKSLKKLLQFWQIPPWLRERIPLVFVNDRLAVVVGYAVSDDFYTIHNAMSIRLVPCLERT